MCQYRQEPESRGRWKSWGAAEFYSLPDKISLLCSKRIHRCAKKAVPSYCRTSNVHSPFLERCEAREMGFLRIRERPPYISFSLFLFLFLFLSNTQTHTHTHIYMCAAFCSHTVFQAHTRIHTFSTYMLTHPTYAHTEMHRGCPILKTISRISSKLRCSDQKVLRTTVEDSRRGEGDRLYNGPFMTGSVSRILELPVILLFFKWSDLPYVTKRNTLYARTHLHDGTHGLFVRTASRDRYTPRAIPP